MSIPTALRRVLNCGAFGTAVTAGVWLTCAWNWQPYLAIGIGIGVFFLISTIASHVWALGILRRNGGRI
jgi:hypothetical protein